MQLLCNYKLPRHLSMMESPAIVYEWQSLQAVHVPGSFCALNTCVYVWPCEVLVYMCRGGVTGKMCRLQYVTI